MKWEDGDTHRQSNTYRDTRTHTLSHAHARTQEPEEERVVVGGQLEQTCSPEKEATQFLRDVMKHGGDLSNDAELGAQEKNTHTHARTHKHMHTHAEAQTRTQSDREKEACA